MLHWLSSHEPSVLRDAEWALQPKDWLRLRLVKRGGSEPSDASGTLLFDIFENTWALPVIEALGLPARLLAPLGASDAVAGGLDGPIAVSLGYPAAFPLPSVLRILRPPLLEPDCLRSGPSSSPWIRGTSSYLRTQPDPDPDLRYHVFATALPGRWYAMAAVQVAGLRCPGHSVPSTQRGRRPTKCLIAHPVTASARHCSYLISPGPVALDEHSAQAGFLGLDLRHGRADMLRAVFEGVAFSIAEAADALPEFVDTAASILQEWQPPSELAPTLCDLLERRCLSWRTQCLRTGAAMLGGRAAGTMEKSGAGLLVAEQVEPDPSAHEVLTVAFERWKEAATGIGHAPR